MEWNNLGWLDLPAYSVSDEGDIRNDASLRNVAQSTTQNGVRKVSLNKVDGTRVTMGVAPLVARNFVDGESNIFDTVINLDGDRSNNRAQNLMWRPRWFAIAYHRQFNFVPTEGAVVCMSTGEVFESPLHAAMRYGILAADVVTSCYRTPHAAYVGSSGVWPLTIEFAWA